MNIAILTQEKYYNLAHDLLLLLVVEYDHNCHISFQHEKAYKENNDLTISLLYNKIIKNNEFNLPRLGTINIHPSLLPHHRGSCPNFWAVLSGTGAGWTAHRMTAAIDRGDIYLQQAVPVLLSDTAETLWDRLFNTLPSFLSKLALLISTDKLESLEIEQDIEQVNTLKQFHEAHNFQELIKEMDPQQQIASYATLTMIQACSFDGYEGFVMDTPDGRVEFYAKRIK